MGNIPARPITEADLDNWFTYHPPTPGQPEIYQHIRQAGQSFATTLINLTPPSKEQEAAIWHIRQAVMVANAAIACTPPNPYPPRPAVRREAVRGVMLGGTRQPPTGDDGPDEELPPSLRPQTGGEE